VLLHSFVSASASQASAPPNSTFSVFTGPGTQAETADDATDAVPAVPRPFARVTFPDAAEGAEAGTISPFPLLFNVVAESFCTTGVIPQGINSKELADASGWWSWRSAAWKAGRVAGGGGSCWGRGPPGGQAAVGNAGIISGQQAR